MLDTAESIGYKSKLKLMHFYYLLGLGVVLFFLILIPMIRAGIYRYLKIFFIPLIVAVVMVLLAVKRIITFKKAPECIIKKDESTLYFWYKGSWKNIRLSEISYVYLNTVKLSRHSGDIILHTANGQKYVICDVLDFDEVKAKIGVFKKIKY